MFPNAILWGYGTLVFLTVFSLAGAAGGAAVLFETKKVWFKLDGMTRFMAWVHLLLVLGATAASIWYVTLWVGEAERFIPNPQILFAMIISSILAVPSTFSLTRELKIAIKIKEEK